MFYCKICKCVIPLTMAHVSGQGRLLPARLQQDKVAALPVSFTRGGREKHGWREGLVRETALQHEETKQEVCWWYRLVSQKARALMLLCEAQAVADWDPAWAGTRPCTSPLDARKARALRQALCCEGTSRPVLGKHDRMEQSSTGVVAPLTWDCLCARPPAEPGHGP